MKKIINGNIVDSDKGSKIAERTSHRSHSGDAIGWETIVLIKGTYYLVTKGGNDIYSPNSNIDPIGVSCKRDILKFVEEHEEWNMNADLIEHIEATIC